MREESVLIVVEVGIVSGITVRFVSGLSGSGQQRWYLLFPAMFFTKIWTVSSSWEEDEESEEMLLERLVRMLAVVVIVVIVTG